MTGGPMIRWSRLAAIALCLAIWALLSVAIMAKFSWKA
jgi:hypothetical protein